MLILLNWGSRMPSMTSLRCTSIQSLLCSSSCGPSRSITKNGLSSGGRQKHKNPCFSFFFLSRILHTMSILTKSLLSETEFAWMVILPRVYWRSKRSVVVRRSSLMVMLFAVTSLVNGKSKLPMRSSLPSLSSSQTSMRTTWFL